VGDNTHEELEMKGRTLLITFLGTGSYQTASYTWNDEVLPPNRFIAVELARRLLKDDTHLEVTVLSTEESRRINGQALKDALQQLEVEACFRVIPYQYDNPAGASQLFEVLADLPQLGYKTVYLDITHAFRAMPFLAGAALAFVQMVNAERQERPDIQILYGAVEDIQREQRSPSAPIAQVETRNGCVWELGDYLHNIDWAFAISSFLQSGRWDQIARLTDREGESHNERARRRVTVLRNLASAMEAFGRDLATVRTRDLLLPRGKDKAATVDLLDRVRESKNDQHVPPALSVVLDRIEEICKPLETSSLQGQAGVQTMGQLARLYWTQGRYLEAAATLREAWVTRCLEVEADVFNRKKREDVAEWLNEIAKDETDPAKRATSDPDPSDPFRKLAKAWNHIRDLRNDLEHGGYNPEPKPGERIDKGLETAIKNFEDFQGDLVSMRQNRDGSKG